MVNDIHPPIEGWKAIVIKDVVDIPSPDYKSILQTIEVKIPAWMDEEGEIFDQTLQQFTNEI